PIPDLFKGSQLIVLGRYDDPRDGPAAFRASEATFTLSGRTANGIRKWTAKVDLPAVETERDFIPQIWAARKIGFLLDQVRLHRSDELIKEIVLLSKQWGIPTEFTSFFVDEPVIVEEAVRRAQEHLDRASTVQSGTWGVTQSMNANAMKAQAQVSASPSAAPMGPQGGSGGRMGNVRGYFDSEGKAVGVDRIQNIGTRTFYQRGSQWVDGQTEGQTLKTIQIKQFSNAHFKLLAAYPGLNQYQRLGNMRMLVNGQALEIASEGKEDLTDAELKAIVGEVKSGANPSPNPGTPHGGSAYAALAFGGLAVAVGLAARRMG
ncbi:MAG: hypothetical protein NTU88_14610, partial [Armatimonadetes bacterium]|nr:hypothetical protein [Armatimonadota bacterium]